MLSSSSAESSPKGKPPWLKVPIPTGPVYQQLKQTAASLALTTVCQEARCPNIGECWAEGTATFMVMGDTCTRGCRFCAVNTGNPQGWLDAEEPQKLADTIFQAGWRYVVLTSVDRDDLPDGGASHFASCVNAIKQANPAIIVETLIPDFQADVQALAVLVASGPEVIAQNIETVERLTHPVRDRRAGYQQTLTVLANIKRLDSSRYTKSSIMLGLGETEEEILQCLRDLRLHGVDMVTLGQYLQPTPKHLPVVRYVPPDEFDAWRQVAEQELGFLYCASGPLVRSSYRAGEFFMRGVIEADRQQAVRVNQEAPLP
ncbi:MAG: lipoyl synthase [Candidatus Melainabacteria bacterium]|nr:lipoyl synthase [Candidatus Melainabacteria bacterium]